MSLPAELMMSIAAPGGGKVVLVLGAGTSIEAPTKLASAASTARDVTRRLISDGVILDGDVSDPSNLPALADAVYARHGTQKPLTDRLPSDSWRLAQPNVGHHEAAALLIEGQLRSILTLNFDLAQQHALSDLSSGTPAASVIRGPEDTARLSGRNLIFLHRSCEANPEEWILRGLVMAEPEQQAWEQAIAASMLMAPTILFVGLNSVAPLLTDTTTKLANAAEVHCYWVDPADPGAFFEALGPKAHHIRMTWTEFARELGLRATREVVSRLQTKGEAQLWAAGETRNCWPQIGAALSRYPLHELGRKRATWLLDDSGCYRPESPTDTQLIADLLSAVALLADALSASVEFDPDGLAVITQADGLSVPCRMASGAGLKTWGSISAQLRREQDRWPHPNYRVVILSDPNDSPDFAPVDLVRETDASDLVRGAQELIPIGTAEILHLASTDADRLARRLAS